MKRTGLVVFPFLFLFLMPEVLADVHLAVEMSRLYRDQEMKQESEFWFAEGKTYQKQGNRITITRKDLGLTWVIDLEQKTYKERKIEPSKKVTSEEEPDFHTLWFDYEPDYDWMITGPGETQVVNGLSCRLYTAVGDADFSEIDSKYWICSDGQVPGGMKFREFLLENLQDDRRRAGLRDILSKNKNSFPVLQEDKVELSIARTLYYKRKLVKLEETKAPPGIYELPEGLRNISRNENRGEKP